MNSRFRRRWVESPALIVVFALFVCGAGTALAASGVGSLVTNGEDGAVGARGAAQPIGLASIGDKNARGDTGTGVAGDRAEGEGDAAEVLGGNKDSSPSSAEAGSASSLPFTGFLAIPLLLLGVGMLVGGVVLRRRSPQLA